MKLRREGVTKGVADTFVMRPLNGSHGMWIEFKYGKNKLTSSQEEFKRMAIQQGYHFVIAYSVIEAINELRKYLNVKS